jgi:hypothetical protein
MAFRQGDTILYRAIAAKSGRAARYPTRNMWIINLFACVGLVNLAESAAGKHWGGWS